MPNPNHLCCNLNSVLLTTAKRERFYSMLLYLCLLTPFWITGLPSLWIKWIQVWSFFQGPVLFLFTWCCFLGSLQLTCVSVAVGSPRLDTAQQLMNFWPSVTLLLCLWSEIRCSTCFFSSPKLVFSHLFPTLYLYRIFPAKRGTLHFLSLNNSLPFFCILSSSGCSEYCPSLIVLQPRDMTYSGN